MSNLGLKEVQDLFKKVGNRRGNLYLSILNKNHRLIRAFESDIGKEILKDATRQLDSLLLKIINEDADEKEKAEFRVLKRILDVWASRVNSYEQTLKKAMEELNNG